MFLISLRLAYFELGEPKKKGKEVELDYFSLAVSVGIIAFHCLEPALVRTISVVVKALLAKEVSLRVIFLFFSEQCCYILLFQ